MCKLKLYCIQLFLKATQRSPVLLKQVGTAHSPYLKKILRPFTGGANLCGADLLWYAMNLQSPKIAGKSHPHGEAGEAPGGWSCRARLGTQRTIKKASQRAPLPHYIFIFNSRAHKILHLTQHRNTVNLSDNNSSST